ncbi:MAG TPA: RNB domain-containing ribonuclease [Flavitalea sp.]|nr:RNB domain-containing ribonuclease [Flavitalea sp.]
MNSPKTIESDASKKERSIFSSQEVRFKLDEKGKPIGIVVKESKEAHQLIEEFMLLANRAVAESVGKVKIDKKEIPFPYRVHDTPDEVKLTPFITFAKKYGHTFDTSTPEGISRSFNQMLDDVKGKPEQHVLEQLGIRTMAKAIYTTENIGHYGLGFEHYCHFTSPIRRYPDIIVHRILQDVLDKTVEPDKKLEQKCKHCSDKERSAMEAERAANKYKQVEYMQDFLGEEFEGVVSGVSSFGFWVETVQHKCEGLVSISGLQDYDDFRLIEGDYSLVGLRSGRKFRMGDKVTIKIVAANLTKRQLDYEWVYPQSATSSQSGDAKIEGVQDAGTDTGTQNVERVANDSRHAGQSHFKNRNSGKGRGGKHYGEKDRSGKHQSEKHQSENHQSENHQSDKKQIEESGFEKQTDKSEFAKQQSEILQSGKSLAERPQAEKHQPEKHHPEKHQAERPATADPDAKDFTTEHFVAEKEQPDPGKLQSSKLQSKNPAATASKPRNTKPANSKSGNTRTESSRSSGTKPGSHTPGSSGSGEPKAPAKSHAVNVKVSKKEIVQPKAKKLKTSDSTPADQQTDKPKVPKHKTKGTPPKSKKPKI